MNGYDIFNKTMQDVLQQEKYDALMGRVEAKKGILDDFMEWLSNNLTNARNASDPNANSGISLTKNNFNNNNQFFVYITIAIVIVAIIIIVAFIFSRIKWSKKTVVANLFDANDNIPLVSKDYFSYSEKNQQKKQWAIAIRYTFLGILLLLNEKNLTDLSETNTTGQISEELKKYKFSEDFNSLLAVFNESWFGKKLIDSEKFDNFKSIFDNLLLGVESEAQND